MVFNFRIIPERLGTANFVWWSSGLFPAGILKQSHEYLPGKLVARIGKGSSMSMAMQAHMTALQSGLNGGEIYMSLEWRIEQV